MLSLSLPSGLALAYRSKRDGQYHKTLLNDHKLLEEAHVVYEMNEWK